MLRTLDTLDLNPALRAVIRHPRTQIIYGRGAQGEPTISLILCPSVAGIIPSDIKSALEVLVRNILFPSLGNPDGPKGVIYE